MASLDDVLQPTRESRRQLAASESSPDAAIIGLVGPLTSLIALVAEIRPALSAEEQSIVYEAMAEISESLTETAAKTAELRVAEVARAAATTSEPARTAQ